LIRWLDGVPGYESSRNADLKPEGLSNAFRVTGLRLRFQAVGFPGSGVSRFSI
jgi:hypothetical protein